MTILENKVYQEGFVIGYVDACKANELVRKVIIKMLKGMEVDEIAEQLEEEKEDIQAIWDFVEQNCCRSMKQIAEILLTRMMERRKEDENGSIESPTY